MSRPSPGERSSIPSPRPLQAKSVRSRTAPSSRPGTAGTTNLESLNAYPPIVPAAVPDPARQHYESPRAPPETRSQTQPRGLGVHSILNPSSDTALQTSTGSTVAAGAGVGQALLPPPTASPRSRKRAEPSSPTRGEQPPSAPTGRRVLTPKSPAARTASIGSRRNPTFQATGPPLETLTGPEPRIYTAEPGSADVPSLPPLGATSRPPLPGLQGADLWPSHGRPQAVLAGPVPGASSIATTQTASPSTSYTSQSQPEQPSPAFRYGAMPATQQPPPSFRQQQTAGPGGYPLELGPRGPPESYQTGQPAYQMTLETDQGPMVVPVELDLQQASKMADEKRKRNAGASARFRARRKEKEKEASHTISSLQQELREIREERDFYRNERNYIRDFTTRHVGLQLPPRPPSPQAHRLAAPPASLQEAELPMEQSGRTRSDSAPAAQRRRTGDYQHPFPGSTQQSPGSQPFGTGYGPAPGFPLPPPPPPQGTGPYASPRSLPPGPSGPPAPLPTAPKSQSSYDPFRKDPFDRSWNPAR